MITLEKLKTLAMTQLDKEAQERVMREVEKRKLAKKNSEYQFQKFQWIAAGILTFFVCYWYARQQIMIDKYGVLWEEHGIPFEWF